MNKLRILFQIFLIIVFLAGIYVVITFDKKMAFEGLINRSEDDCPDLLISKDSILLLYNTRKPAIEGINPVKFNDLDDYKNYLEIQRKEGIHCPVLFLQHEYDVQGKGVYRAHSSPLQMEGGITRTQTIPNNPEAINAMLGTSGIPLYSPTNYAEMPPKQPIIYKDDTDKGIPVPIIDASREHGDYNKGNYAGFDPTSLYVGKYTEIDKIHDMTGKQSQSDNPMDSNWGGIEHTQKAVDSGKYEENNITKPRLFQPKLVFDPTLPSGFQPPKDVV